MKKRYAIVGTGFRGINMFLEPLVKEFGEVAEVVALCDLNPKRATVANTRIGLQLPIYISFSQLLQEVVCDTVIVASTDCTHHEIIIQALRHGKDVITEKPLTIDAEKCQEILKAEKESGKKLTVTFNLRYNPFTIKLKELILAGKVGEIFSVELQWFLDTRHGADYYRRWHAELKNSGGLFIHKSTHHFDLVNWLLGQEPEKVYASGQLRFYGAAKRQAHGERCLTCAQQKTCPFYFDLRSDPELEDLYLKTEDIDGYWRDRCVFADRIDIYDTMAALVHYRNGTVLTYNLFSFMPYEGWHLAINGSLGRLECYVPYAFYPEEERDFAKRGMNSKEIDPWLAAAGDLTEKKENIIRFYPMFGGVETIVVPKAKGEHGGGDIRLRKHLFTGKGNDPIGRMADSRAGVMSILIGIAANKSVATGKPVLIDSLLV